MVYLTATRLSQEVAKIEIPVFNLIDCCCTLGDKYYDRCGAPPCVY
jgi:hypothetical protein